MSKSSNNKFKMITLMNILLEMTDEEHGIKMRQIKDSLERNGISAGKNMIYKDIRLLERFGIIVEKRRKGNDTFYHVVDKPLTVEEARLIVDAIQSCRFLSEKQTLILIDKVMQNLSMYEKSKIKKCVYVPGRVKSTGKNQMDVVHQVMDAINTNKQIVFAYGNWNKDKKMQRRVPIKDYVVSPWSVIWKNEKYYMLGYDEESKEFKHYRLDKIMEIEVSTFLRHGHDKFKELDIARYADRHFGMYGGKMEAVTLRTKPDKVFLLLDEFGMDIPIRTDENGMIETRVEVAVNNQFFGWLFSLYEEVELVKPEAVKERLLLYAKNFTEGYGVNPANDVEK